MPAGGASPAGRYLLRSDPRLIRQGYYHYFMFVLLTTLVAIVTGATASGEETLRCAPFFTRRATACDAAQ